MLAGISSRHVGASASAARQFSLRSQRQLSSFAANRTSTLRLARARGGYGIARSSNNGALRFMALPVSTVRFASSNSTPATEGTPTPESAVDPGSPSLSEIDIASIPEKLGYLKELGLDYGWGISSMVETALEVLHIYGGLTWCGSAIAAAVLVRLALLRPMLLASDTTAKFSAIRSELAPIQIRMATAARAGDNAAAVRAKQEMTLIKEQHGIKSSRMWYPMLQIPIGYCFFRVFRGMSYMPVPTLTDESFLWLNDVTVADPYFMLPVMTSACLYLTMKRGGETGMQSMATPLRQFLQNGLPLISFMFMVWWPGILQIYFATTGALSLGQTYLTTTPKFRELAGIAQLPQPAAKPAQAESKVIDVQPNGKAGVFTKPKDSFIDRTIDGVKNWFKESRKGMEDMVKQYQGEQEDKDANALSKRYTKEELQQAKSYSERRKMEAEYQRELINERRREEYRRKMEKAGR